MNKRRIIINRKKQLRSYFSHLWVVSKISRQDFRKNFLLGDLPCGEEDSAYWGMYWGLHDLKGNRKFKLVCSPQDLGVAIKSGERIELEIDDNINGIFVIQRDGVFSNEILFDDNCIQYELTLSVKGGYHRMQYTFLTLESKS